MATRVFNFASSSLLVENLKNFFPEMGTSETEVKQAMTKVLKTYLKGFGLNLKKIRTKKGINQVPFAKQLGVTQTTYSFWETGSHVPRLSKISMISELLGIDVGELFFDEISNPTQNIDIGYLPIYDGSSFFSKTYEDIATKRVLLSPKELILDAYRGEYDFAFKSKDTAVVGESFSIPLNALVMCSSAGLIAEKEKDLLLCSGKIVLISITRQQALLKRVFFDGKILKVESLSKDEQNYEFPLTEDAYNEMENKTKAIYHNQLIYISDIEIFAIARKCVFDL